MISGVSHGLDLKDGLWGVLVNTGKDLKDDPWISVLGNTRIDLKDDPWDVPANSSQTKYR